MPVAEIAFLGPVALVVVAALNGALVWRHADGLGRALGGTTMTARIVRSRRPAEVIARHALPAAPRLRLAA